MSVHIDLSWFLLAGVAVAYFVGFLGWEPAVILMLAFGLPYGGPP